MIPGTTTYNQRAPSSKAYNTAQEKQKQQRPVPQILVPTQRDARTGCTYYFRDKSNVMSLNHTLAQGWDSERDKKDTERSNCEEEFRLDQPRQYSRQDQYLAATQPRKPRTLSYGGPNNLLLRQLAKSLRRISILAIRVSHMSHGS
ncbi:hypothetical protein E4U39_003387 [Claviceps sp. Clav50 group G5]|nr:hypothetical protein E4U39_003387 [Claviceps sp. Clav50 group G5]